MRNSMFQPLSGKRLKPVGFLAGRCLRSEEDVKGTVCVLQQALFVAVEIPELLIGLQFLIDSRSTVAGW